MKLWDGDLGDGVVHSEALGVFYTIWFHSGLVRGMPAVCVENGNTQRKNSFFPMGKICKSTSKVQVSSSSLTLRDSAELCSFNVCLKKKMEFSLTC